LPGGLGDYTVCVDHVVSGGGGCLVFRDGVLVEVREEPSGLIVFDFRGRGSRALPGFADIHVHLRGLGLAYKEDEYTGSAAAAAGCVTLVADMPNTVPELRTPGALAVKLSWLSRLSVVGYAVYAGVPREAWMARVMASQGAAGFKVYPEDVVGGGSRLCAALRAAEEVGLLVVLHPEHPALFSPDWGFLRGLYSRPCEAEAAAVEELAEAMEECGARPRVHVTHVSCPLTAAKAWRHGFTVDVALHHLLADWRFEEAAGWCRAKVNPPLKSHLDVNGLLQELASGRVSCLASDHAPHARQDKNGNPAACAPGFSWLEWWALAAYRMLSRSLGVERAVDLLSREPRRILGAPQAGIEPGGSPSISIVLEDRVDTHPRGYSRGVNNPFHPLPAAVCGATIVRGRLHYLHPGALLAGPGSGEREAPPLH